MINRLKRLFGIHVHVWNQWEVIEEGQISRADRTIGRYTYQKRTCSHCGLREEKMEKLYL